MPARWPGRRRSTRMRPCGLCCRLIAWGLALLAVALVAGGLVLDRIAAGEQVEEAGNAWLYPWLLLAVAMPAAIGALIASRRPGNSVGWILVAGGLSLAVVLSATPYAHVALGLVPGRSPAGPGRRSSRRSGRSSSPGRWRSPSSSRTAACPRRGGARSPSSRPARWRSSCSCWCWRNSSRLPSRTCRIRSPCACRPRSTS